MLFYIGALALCAAAFLMIRKAAVDSRLVVVTSNRSKLRVAGRVVLGIAASFAGLGMLAQVVAHSH
jgi:hypothetical protein